MRQSSTSALLYDYLFQAGGAEYVTLLLARAFPALDVFVASRSHERIFADLPDNLGLLETNATPRGRFQRAFMTHRVFARSKTRLNGYSQIIYTGIHSPFAILKNKPERAILYCHTSPLPFVYDWYDYYLRSLDTGSATLLRALAPGIRRRFERAIAKMDVIVPNSRYVKRCYETNLGAEVGQVIYPPCELDRFRFEASEGYYLSTARLEAHKRVDVIVSAFLEIPARQLVVASTGSELGKLKRLAAGARNIQFIETTDRSRIAELLSRCTALIYIPYKEHFGLSAVEALASGKPVIAVDEGALPEIVERGRTGYLIAKADVSNLCHAVKKLDKEHAEAMREACERRAADFSMQRFIAQMEELLRLDARP